MQADPISLRSGILQSLQPVSTLLLPSAGARGCFSNTAKSSMPLLTLSLKDEHPVHTWLPSLTLLRKENFCGRNGYIAV